MEQRKGLAVLLAVFSVICFSAAASAALPPASTSPKALHVSDEGGFWILTQSDYRENISERAIRYSSEGVEQGRLNLAGLNYNSIEDLAKYSGGWAVLTGSSVQAYGSSWENGASVSVSGDPEIIVSHEEKFYLVDKVYEGGKNNYYVQKVSHSMDNFSSKKKIGTGLKIKALDRFNGSWVALTPGLTGATLRYYNNDWEKVKDKRVHLPARSQDSSLIDFQVTRNVAWILTSKEGGFGGKVHQLTPDGKYTGKVYDVGLNSTVAEQSVSTRELEWTLPTAIIATVALLWIFLAIAIAIFLLLIGPYRTWRKHLKEDEGDETEEEEESSGEKASDSDEEED